MICISKVEPDGLVLNANLARPWIADINVDLVEDIGTPIFTNGHSFCHLLSHP